MLSAPPSKSFQIHDKKDPPILRYILANVVQTLQSWPWRPFRNIALLKEGNIIKSSYLYIIYLMTFSIAQNQMILRFMNNELDGVRKDSIVT
jgi:hypothetical protein